MSYYTLREAAEVLQDSNYFYKGKTVVYRTIVTMAENGIFKTLKICDCSIKSRLVRKSEIERMTRFMSG